MRTAKVLLLGIIIGSLGSYIVTVILTLGTDFLFGNVYVTDFFFYFSALIGVTLLSRHYFKTGNRKLVIGILVGFIPTYLFAWIAHLWGLGEGECTRYFFQIFTNC